MSLKNLFSLHDNHDNKNPAVRRGGKSPQKNQGVDRKRPRWASLVIFMLKLFCIWLPLLSVVLLVASFIAGNVLLTPERVQGLAMSQFNSMSNARLSLNVKAFNLYGDVVIENIVITNPKGFGKGNFLEIKKFVLRHGFFSMLVGNIHFDEIGIYKPRIYLIQKNGVWNIDRLMKPGTPEPEKKEEEKTPSTRTEINLPFNFSFLLNFTLDDLRCYIRGDDFKADLAGLTLKCNIKVPPFKTIPLSPRAVTLLEQMEITLNPEEKVDLSFYSPDASVEPPLVLTWRLVFDKGGGKNDFASSFKFGTYKTPVRFKRSHLAPLDFLVSYDLSYDPVTDYLRLNDFGIRFGASRWINLSGTVKDAAKDPAFDISMKQSEISLTELYPYYRSLTGDEETRFSGRCSLFPLTVRGNAGSMSVRGNVAVTSLALKVPDFEIAIPSLDLGYGLDKRGSGGKIRAKLSIPRFTYKLERSPSGINALALNADVDSSNDFSHFVLNNVDVAFYDPRGIEKAVSFSMRGAVDTAQGIKGDFSMPDFVFKKNAFASTLPEAIAKDISGLPFTKPVGASIKTTFSLGEPLRLSFLAGLRVPDFNVPDLELKGDIVMHGARARIDIPGIRLGSRTHDFTVKVKGFLETKRQPISDSNLSIDLSLGYPAMTKIYGPLSLAGSMRISAEMKGDLVKGRTEGTVKIDNLSLKNSESMLDVNGLNLDFPFEYDFAYKPSDVSRLAVDKSSLFENQFFREKENLSVKSISARHPARETGFAYLKDLHGTLFFRGNIFEIQELRATLLDGTLYGKNIFFYLSDLKKENMEYRLALDATNIDVSLLDNPNQKKKSHDAELSLNTNISGRGLDFSRGMNINGSVNIYKIGERFANKLMKGLSQEKGKSKLGIAQPIVDNLEIPRAFYYYIDNGIMYTDVSFRSKVIGYVVGIKDDRVKFDRVPIQEYLKKVQE